MNMIKYIIFLISLCNCTMGIGQVKSGWTVPRSEIPEKYKWDTHDIFVDNDAWEREFQLLEADLPGYEKYRESLSSSAGILLEGLKFDESIKKRLGYVGLYTKLHRDVDMSNAGYQERWERYKDLESRVNAASAFLQPTLLMLSESQMDVYLEEEPALQIYQHYFEALALKRDHIPSPDR